MASPQAKVVSISPSYDELPGLLAAFCKKDGTIVCGTEALLRTVADWTPPDFGHAQLVGDFAGTVMRLIQQPTLQGARIGHQRAIVRSLCERLEPDSPFYRSRMRPGLHQAIVDALSRLRHWGWKGDDLVAVGTHHPKIHELARFAQELSEGLAQKGLELVSERYFRCLDIAPEPINGVSRVLAIMGSQQDPLAMAWLEWLAACGVSVTIVVEDHPGFAQRHQSSLVQFQSDRWTHHLFSDAIPERIPIRVSIESMSDDLSECEWALRSILELERRGLPQSDIGIFVRRAEAYAPLLMSCAIRLGVSLAVSMRIPLLSSGFASTVVQLLEALAQPDIRALEPVLASSYFALTRNQLGAVSQAIRAAYKSSEDAWQELVEGSAKTGDDLRWIGDLLKWRQVALSESASWPEWCARLIELGHILPFVSEASKQSNPLLERDIRAQQVMQRSLAEAIDSPACNLGEFVHRAKTLWSVETVILPSDKGGVRVASDPISLVGVKQLFVLGMSEGTFPRRQAEDPILFDADISLLNERKRLQTPIPTSQELAQQERDLFIRLCDLPSEGLTLTYPQSEDDRDNIPAFYLSEIERITGDTLVKRRYTFRDFAPEPESCLTHADLSLAEALRAPLVLPEEPHLNEEDALRLVRTSEDEPLSPWELEDVLDCPFRASMRYRLRLRGPLNTRLRSVLPKIAEKARVPMAATPEQALSSLEQALQFWIEEHYADLERFERKLLEAAAKRYFPGLIEREFEARERWKRQPEKTMAGVELGERGLQGEFSENQTLVRLRFTAPFLADAEYGSRIITFSNEEPPVDDEEVGLPYLLMDYVQKKRSRLTTVEVDVTRGKRILLYSGPSDDQHSEKAHPYYLRPLFKGNDRAQFPRIRRAAAEAVRLWQTHTMVPQPGDACNYCAYGDVCRRSRDSSEALDPIETGDTT